MFMKLGSQLLPGKTCSDTKHAHSEWDRAKFVSKALSFLELTDYSRFP